MRRIIFDADEAVASITIVAADLDGVGDVRIDQNPQADHRFIAAMPRLKRARLKSDLARRPCLRIMRQETALRHQRVHQRLRRRQSYHHANGGPLRTILRKRDDVCGVVADQLKHVVAFRVPRNRTKSGVPAQRFSDAYSTRSSHFG